MPRVPHQRPIRQTKNSSSPRQPPAGRVQRHCYRSQSVRLRHNRTEQNATVMDQVVRSVTVIDPARPLYGRLFPLVRWTSSRGRSYLVLRLSEGRTRSVPRSATDFVPIPSPPLVTGLLPVSVRTLLSVARRLRSMARAQEEAPHAATLCCPPCRSDAPAGIGTDPASALTTPALESSRPVATPPVCPTLGSSAVPEARRSADTRPGGPR